MTERMPILFNLAEVERLHGLAYTTAIQTGAKGEELDHLTAEVFRSLAGKANRDVLAAKARPKLHLVSK
jgi:hypothetical protein